MVDNFFPYSQQSLGFDKPVEIIFQSDDENASKMLGKTAYYDPENLQVVLYTDGRHPKDVMRSLSHELVHHAQNCRGDFTSDSATYEGYAQEDPHLRKMEREAYTKGNLIFRDFEDLIKTGKINIEIDFSDSGEPKMSLKEWKNDEINRKLMKKWGLLKEGTAKERNDEEGNRPSYAKDLDLDEGHEHGPECGCPDMEEGMKYRKEDDWGKSPAAFTGTEDEEDEAISHLKRGKALEEDSEGEETYHYGEDEGRDEKELRDLERRHATHAHIRALKRDMDYDEDHEDRRERGDHFREGAEDEVDEVKRHVVGANPDLADFIMPNKPKGEAPPPGQRVWDPRHLKDKTTKVAPVKVPKEGKISVREAKQITRRIIERIRKEGK